MLRYLLQVGTYCELIEENKVAIFYVTQDYNNVRVTLCEINDNTITVLKNSNPISLSSYIAKILDVKKVSNNKWIVVTTTAAEFGKSYTKATTVVLGDDNFFRTLDSCYFSIYVGNYTPNGTVLVLNDGKYALITYANHTKNESIGITTASYYCIILEEELTTGAYNDQTYTYMHFKKVESVTDIGKSFTTGILLSNNTIFCISTAEVYILYINNEIVDVFSDKLPLPLILPTYIRSPIIKMSNSNVAIIGYNDDSSDNTAYIINYIFTNGLLIYNGYSEITDTASNSSIASSVIEISKNNLLCSFAGVGGDAIVRTKIITNAVKINKRNNIIDNSIVGISNSSASEGGVAKVYLPQI